MANASGMRHDRDSVAALVLLATALIGFGWVKGSGQVQAQWDAAVREKGDAIIKEVPVSVPEKADAACTITRGSMRLHDAAAAGERPSPPETLMRPPQALRFLPSPEPSPPTTRPVTKTPSN